MLFSADFDVDGRLAVISGGSQGLGAALGRLLFSKGASVVIVARTEAKLSKTAKEIENFRVNSNQKVSFVSADLTLYEECEKVFTSIETPDILINCAGYSHPALFLDLTATDLKQGINTNYNCAAFFTHAGLKKMAKVKPQHRRHILFCSSVLATYPFIGYGHYAPLKSAVKTLSDVLRQECLVYNIRVECAFPGNFMSEGFVEEEKTKPEITKQIEGPSEAISADKCAEIIFRAIDKGYDYITTDTPGYLLSTFVLGNSPRQFWVFQVIIAFFVSLFAPIANVFVNRMIKKYFETHPIPGLDDDTSDVKGSSSD
ncbi:unnamed protein product [Kuraishia capsulata CBS 1993]|uniref:3-ketodihydrosphingosine reductase TSC10 n=1 Tax=Kuraishia capsulata CBS 1993 TaxID=1382522 RepID=W6MQY0_9ASCO|nr:uncharacterized protein KUCA_T00000245001 [Kuraishia capsulata CBS 1993]CDK24285.1 unnamed protein product [Kuraishia capsulata CBS 1993]